MNSGMKSAGERVIESFTIAWISLACVMNARRPNRGIFFVRMTRGILFRYLFVSKTSCDVDGAKIKRMAGITLKESGGWMKKSDKTLTTAFGIPVGDDQNSMTAGARGPVLMQGIHRIEKLAHFDRERIPERVVHAKGAGAHGYFEVTADVTKFTKAAFLSQSGKKTAVFVRFSMVGGEKGSADAARDPRGFAIKFYTEEGNYDLAGNNTPVFFIRDPLKFPDFIHTQKRHPATNLPDANMFWDFLSLTPESVHQVTILFLDRGTPATYRHMNGYSSATQPPAPLGFWLKSSLVHVRIVNTLVVRRFSHLSPFPGLRADSDPQHFFGSGQEALLH